MHAKTPVNEDEIASVALAIDSDTPLDYDRIQSFIKLIKWEIETLLEELKGKVCTQIN